MSARKKDKNSKIIWTSSSRMSGSGSFRGTKEALGGKEVPKVKLPCAEAVSVQQVIVMMFVHVCRKIIYGLDVSYRICIYVLGTLMVSVVSDYKTSAASRSYFADSENILNQWFVKLGWFWTCSLLGSFIYLTSSTISCGRPDVVRKSLFRLAIATFVWFSLTSFFELVEYKTGLCDMTKFRRKESCLGNGHNWKGFDISGHVFILIFCNLVIIEEGKAYLGWEKIKDFLRNEEHGRVNPDNEKRETPLGKLKYEEFIHIRKFYPENTPWVRAVFCLLAVIISLWDFMLLCTVLYFHMMIEKVVASGLAVLSWFALYKFFYRQDFSPGLPGSGPFKYVTWQDPFLMTKEQRTKALRRHREAETTKWSSKDEVPKFMGMPLYALKDYKEEEVKKDLTEEEVFRANGLASGRGSMSSMGSLSSMPHGRRGSISELSGVPGRSRARSRSQSRNRVSGSRDGASKTRLNSHHVNPVGWS